MKHSELTLQQEQLVEKYSFIFEELSQGFIDYIFSHNFFPAILFNTRQQRIVSETSGKIEEAISISKYIELLGSSNILAEVDNLYQLGGDDYAMSLFLELIGSSGSYSFVDYVKLDQLEPVVLQKEPKQLDFPFKNDTEHSLDQDSFEFYENRSLDNSDKEKQYEDFLNSIRAKVNLKRQKINQEIGELYDDHNKLIKEESLADPSVIMVETKYKEKLTINGLIKYLASQSQWGFIVCDFSGKVDVENNRAKQIQRLFNHQICKSDGDLTYVDYQSVHPSMRVVKFPEIGKILIYERPSFISSYLLDTVGQVKLTDNLYKFLGLLHARLGKLFDLDRLAVAKITKNDNINSTPSYRVKYIESFAPGMQELLNKGDDEIIERGLLYQTLQTKNPFVVDDYHAGHYKANIVVGKLVPAGISSGIILPLFDNNGEPIAFMFFNAKKKKNFTDHNVKILNRFIGSLSSIVEVFDAFVRLLNEAGTDPLTKIIGNRKRFENDLFILGNDYARSNNATTVIDSQTVKTRRIGAYITLDIDKFKSINDTYGHDVGDEVIKAIANCLTGSLRIGETSNIYRLGGEEFGIFLADVVNSLDQELMHHSDPIQLAQEFVSRIVLRIQNNLNQLKLQTGLGYITPKVSIGVTLFTNGFTYDDKGGMVNHECHLDTRALDERVVKNLQLVTKAADQLLYYQKTHGRNGSTMLNTCFDLFADEGGSLIDNSGVSLEVDEYIKNMDGKNYGITSRYFNSTPNDENNLTNIANLIKSIYLEVGDKKVSFFNDLTMDEILVVYEMMQQTSYKEGESILKSGEEIDSLYLIAQGKVMVKSYYNENSIESSKLDIWKCFGEKSFVSNFFKEDNGKIFKRGLSTIDVRAIEGDVIVYKITWSSFNFILSYLPGLYDKIVNNLKGSLEDSSYVVTGKEIEKQSKYVKTKKTGVEYTTIEDEDIVNFLEESKLDYEILFGRLVHMISSRRSPEGIKIIKQAISKLKRYFEYEKNGKYKNHFFYVSIFELFHDIRNISNQPDKSVNQKLKERLSKLYENYNVSFKNSIWNEDMVLNAFGIMSYLLSTFSRGDAIISKADTVNKKPEVRKNVKINKLMYSLVYGSSQLEVSLLKKVTNPNVKIGTEYNSLKFGLIGNCLGFFDLFTFLINNNYIPSGVFTEESLGIINKYEHIQLNQSYTNILSDINSVFKDYLEKLNKFDGSQSNFVGVILYSFLMVTYTQQLFNYTDIKTTDKSSIFNGLLTEIEIGYVLDKCATYLTSLEEYSLEDEGIEVMINALNPNGTTNFHYLYKKTNEYASVVEKKHILDKLIVNNYLPSTPLWFNLVTLREICNQDKES